MVAELSLLRVLVMLLKFLGHKTSNSCGVMAKKFGKISAPMYLDMKTQKYGQVKTMALVANLS